jgi:Zn-dependent peptidase ImmA (M78 family)/transcriptional regulator with XRE-family HTH domain
MARTMTAQDLGARLRAAREAVGLSQQQAAKHLGLRSHHPIVRMEAGERDVTTLELSTLARLYCQPLSYFVREETSDPEANAVLLRSHELAVADRNEISRAVAQCHELEFLARVLGRSPSEFGAMQFDLPLPATHSQATEQGEMIARRIRATLGLGYQPIANLPRLIGELGIGVFRVALGSSAVAGISLAQPTYGGCILVNRKDSPERQLFTIAHEIFHLLVDHQSHRCSTERNEDNLLEARAEAFASALLVPREGLERYREDLLGIAWRELEPVHAIRLQFHFLVSYRALIVRLRCLGLITEAHAQRLLQVSPHHLARMYNYEPDLTFPISQAFEQLLRTLAIEAYERGKISRGRLATILDIEDEELAELLRGLGVNAPRLPPREGPNPLMVAGRNGS